MAFYSHTIPKQFKVRMDPEPLYQNLVSAYLNCIKSVAELCSLHQVQGQGSEAKLY